MKVTRNANKTESRNRKKTKQVSSRMKSTLRPLLKSKKVSIKNKSITPSKKENIDTKKKKNKDRSQSSFIINTESDSEDSIEESEDETGNENNLFNEEASEDNSDVDSVENYDNEVDAHKKSLAKLKEVDPEFYKFLEENDKKLLHFDVSDEEEINDRAKEADESVHKPNEDLEVASDEDDFESTKDDLVDGELRKVTLKMLKTWQSDLQTDKSNKTIGCVVKAFHAALIRVSSQNDEETPEYRVEGSSVFNAVIQLCVLELGPAVRRFLGITNSKQPPHKCKRFVKVKSLLKGYFSDLLKLLGGVTSPNILAVLLKHMHYMLPLMVSFPNLAKPAIKRLVYLWGTADETVRVIAFLCIVRLVSNQQTSLLDTTLKAMYLTYVKNSKFVSVSTWPGINFMRRSLVEIFALDLNVAYQHVFLYVRQLAIHLRNAITMHKKEHIQAVYNWQFINSLKLWGNLLESTYDKPQLKPLLYPFVQVCLGTIKLVPTAQYYPLRFHVLQVLIDLSRETEVFIPILPFLVEVLQTFNFNKKHTKVSMKPLQFTCVLRLSKSQMQENGFKDALIDSIYAQLLEYMSYQSHSIAFPDLSLFCVMQIKIFLKTCHVTNYCKKMRQVLEKIQQTNDFIEKERKTVSFALTDSKQVEAWQTLIKNKGTPLTTYYNDWNKIRTIKKNKLATENDKIAEYNLPTIKKAKKENMDNKSETENPPNPFPSDSESDNEFNFGDSDDEKPKQNEKKSKRGARGKKTNQKLIRNGTFINSVSPEGSDAEDLIEDIKLSEW